MLRTFQDYDDIEGLVICLELVLRELIAQEHLAGLDENEEAAGEDVPWIPQGTIADDNEIQQDQAPPVVYTGSVGRPKFEITREQINFLVESGFTGPQIASLIGVSLSTVRRMVYFGLSIGAQYLSITVSELDDFVRR